MKSILNKIKDLCYQPKEDNNEKSSDITNTNYITFLIDEHSGEPYIKMSIKNLSDVSAKQYAEMLYDINHGLYNESILKILMDFSKEDELINKFVKDVIMYWYAALTLNNKNVEDNNQETQKPWLKKPQISPLEFNKNAK